tara:strand:+ start:337 stop:594 length:258 start_codon:yes stop_codon:yes gene_type:complete
MEQKTMEQVMSELDDMMNEVMSVAGTLVNYGRRDASGEILSATFEVVHQVIHDLWLHTDGNRLSVRAFLDGLPTMVVDEDDDDDE